MNNQNNSAMYSSLVNSFKNYDAYKYSYDNIKFGIQETYIQHKQNRKCKPQHRASVPDIIASGMYWKTRLHMAVLIDEDVKGGYGGTASRPVKRYLSRGSS